MNDRRSGNAVQNSAYRSSITCGPQVREDLRAFILSVESAEYQGVIPSGARDLLRGLATTPLSQQHLSRTGCNSGTDSSPFGFGMTRRLRQESRGDRPSIRYQLALSN